mgnify:CR=1 FL=1
MMLMKMSPMNPELEDVRAWVWCSCGQKHELQNIGDYAPIYWCGRFPFHLKEGQEVEIEDES